MGTFVNIEILKKVDFYALPFSALQAITLMISDYAEPGEVIQVVTQIQQTELRLLDKTACQGLWDLIVFRYHFVFRFV